MVVVEAIKENEDLLLDKTNGWNTFKIPIYTHIESKNK